MTYPTSTKIASVINAVVEDVRASIGMLGKELGFIYEGSDGMYVVTRMTAYEAYLVDSDLYGQEVADHNSEVLKA